MDADIIGNELDRENLCCKDSFDVKSEDAKDRELYAVKEHLYTVQAQLVKMTHLLELLIKQQEK